jgi:hypothetical protein
MRDVKRIERILNLLRAYWTQYPDLRLGQILGNATPPTPPKRWVGADGRKKSTLEPGFVYNLEDTKLEEWLRKQLDPLTQIAADVRSNEVEKL